MRMVFLGRLAIILLVYVPSLTHAQLTHDDEELFRAVFFGRVSLAERLLARGANPNAFADKVPDGEGMFLVGPVICFSLGNKQMLDLLIQAGANVNVGCGNSSASVLHNSAWEGSFAEVETLINAGANVNHDAGMAGYMSGKPLHVAAERGHAHLVPLLLSAGADINAKNYEGDTARDIANRRGHDSVVDALDRAAQGQYSDKRRSRNTTDPYILGKCRSQDIQALASSGFGREEIREICVRSTGRGANDIPDTQTGSKLIDVKPKRGWLGVLIQDVTRDLADSFGMRYPRGALVAQVVPDSPAEAAGLQAGDIILHYNGEEVRVSSALPPLVGNSRVNEKVTLNILRKRKYIDFQVEISELPAK